MRPHQQLLLDLLAKHGWELIEQIPSDEWWVEEFWRIQSVREQWGQQIVLSFLVDPMYEGDKKRQAIWSISATAAIPQGRLEAEAALALLSMTKGKFDEKLPAFVDLLDRYRGGS